MFTDRFISIPIKIYSVSLKDLTGKEELEDSVMKINPFEISRYHPSNKDGDDEDFNCVRITFKDGECVICYLPMNEFENLLNGVQ